MSPSLYALLVVEGYIVLMGAGLGALSCRRDRRRERGEK